MNNKIKMIVSAMLVGVVLAGCSVENYPDDINSRKAVSSAEEETSSADDNSNDETTSSDIVNDIVEDILENNNESESEILSDNEQDEEIDNDSDSDSEKGNLFNDLIGEIASEAKNFGKDEKKFDWAVNPISNIDVVTPLFYYQPKSLENSSNKYDYDVGSIGSILYQDVVAVRTGGKWGLMNYDGKYILDPEYTQIVLGFMGKISAKKDNSKYYLVSVNFDGSVSVSPDSEMGFSVIGTNGVQNLVWAEDDGKLYQAMSNMPYEHTSGIYSAMLGEMGSYGQVTGKNYGTQSSYVSKYVLVTDGERVGTEIYDAGGNYSDGIIPFKKDGKWGYVNSKGETVIPFEYDDSCNKKESFEDAVRLNYPKSAFSSSDGYVVLCKDGEYALFTSSNETVIPFGEYEQICPVYEGKAWVLKDGNWGVIQID